MGTLEKKLGRLALIVLVIWLFFFLALDSMVDDSPTMDEQNHLARGAAFVQTGDPRLSLEHPPLVNSLSSLPLLLLPDLQLPFDHPSWTEQQPPDVYWYVFADQFLWQVNQDVTRMIFLGRLPIVFLTLGLALVGFHFAREFWGRPSATLAFFLLLFEPNILAHGRLITTDLGGTLFITLALLLVWRLWTAPDWARWRWLAAGVGLGLAFGSKLSMLTFVPILAVVAFLPIFNAEAHAILDCRRRGIFQRLVQLGGAGVISILVVWAIFGFEWGMFRFPSETFDFLNRFSGPLPTFWAGVDQIVNVSRGGRMAFLLGESSDQGFWLFFPVAFLVKTPLVLLGGLLGLMWLGWKQPALSGSTALSLPKWPSTRSKLLFLFIPAILYFTVSVISDINIGYRHLLPILPLIIVGVSGLPTLFARRNDAGDEQAYGKRAWWRGGDAGHSLVMLVLALGVLLPTLWIHPHYLSFFNLAAGGSANGASILADSSNDWGQDLLRLQDWMAENGEESIKLGWFGTADPAYYDINFEPMPGFPRAEFLGLWNNPPFNPENPEPDLYAISASSLWESHWEARHVYAWFRAQEPTVRIGYSIYIYDLR